MEATAPPRRRRLPYVLRIVSARPRLIASIFVGLAVFWWLPVGPAVYWGIPVNWRPWTRAVCGWDVGVFCYLLLVYALIARSHVGLIREHAGDQDEGRVAILVLTVAAALASLGAIVVELGTAFGSNRETVELVLAMATILLSWGFTHTIFAVHYAHEFYSENDGKGGGLMFPGKEEPDYWDFVYFAFVIGMTSQVSDVAVSCKPIRRTVAAHGILSFVFNTALLALTVNIAAGAIQE